MSTHKRRKVAFKPYDQNQGTLLPTYLDDLIPEGHLVRVVNAGIDKLDLTALLDRYPGGGASSFHPLMMLKVLVYAYCERIYSSRRIAKALRENINFMWLSGRSSPDFRTIARFRSGRLQCAVEEVFASVVEMLLSSGHVKLENYFVDGTKIEANAGRYTWVWGRNTARYHSRLQVRVRQLLKQIDEAEADEQDRYGDRDLEELGEDAEVSSQMLEAVAERINEKLGAGETDREARRVKKKIERDYLPRLRKYEQQRKILGRRNSYSKTDTDATFMRMKEDHMGKARPKPGYNVQTGTEDQFIVGYSVHQFPADTNCLKPHMDKLEKQLDAKPKNVIADAGYGSEENYEYLEDKEITAYVKDNYFHLDSKRKNQKDIYNQTNWPYDEAADSYSCPAAQPFNFSHEQHKRTKNGFLSRYRVYQNSSCVGCEHKKRCCPDNNMKLIRKNPTLDRHRQAARSLLRSEKGVKLRSLRGVEVETVFAQIKHNMGFRRFMLRGLEKVSTEWGLLSIAHNLKKLGRHAAA